MFKYKETSTHKVIEICKVKIKLRKEKKNKILYVTQTGNIKQLKKLKGLKINFKGKNSTVKIFGPINTFNNCQFNIGSNCLCEIDYNKETKLYGINNFNLEICDNSTITIGKNFYCGEANVFVDFDSKLSIGDNCMFSVNINIRCGDGSKHVLIDLKNNTHKQLTGNVKIGNHVWVGIGASFLKNAQIGDNSIVGAYSVVSKRFKEENIAIAGNPAKIVKENIDWKPYD